MSKTSVQWWEEMKADTSKFNDWLVKQYRGEVTASNRILQFSDKYCKDVRNKQILAKIADQESQHAEWVLSLLKTRGISTGAIIDAEERYWKEALPAIESFETGAAVGAHAEKMRLERIRVIANDISAPADVKDVFSKILKDELFHESAFRKMATPEIMNATLPSHQRGMELLGLEALILVEIKK